MSPGRPRLIRKLDMHPAEPPLVAHIWGLNPDNFYTVAHQIASGELAQELGLKRNFAGIDLNMGCPAKLVVKTGACSALINDHELAARIIQATKKGAGGLPVSVKTRLGYNRIETSWTKFLLSQDLAMLSVHLRTTKEMSMVEPHYDELERISQERTDISPGTLLVANGDITSRQQGEQLGRRYNLDGIMIGRGVFRDPYVFSPVSPWESLPAVDRIKLFQLHLNSYNEWSEAPDKGAKRLNKYAKIYINGFSGAKELREKIAQTTTIAEMIGELNTAQAAYGL